MLKTAGVYCVSAERTFLVSGFSCTEGAVCTVQPGLDPSVASPFCLSQGQVREGRATQVCQQ